MAVYFHLSTGSVILDIAVLGLVAGVCSYEIAYKWGNNRHQKH